MNKVAKTGVCPNCNSENISYGSIELDGCQAYFPCECEECGTTFNECYDLDFVGNAEIFNGEEEIDFLSA